MQSSTEDRIILELLKIQTKLEEHDRRFDQMVTRDEFHKTIDHIAGRFDRFEQEYVFMNEAIRRHDDAIERINTHLKIA